MHDISGGHLKAGKGAALADRIDAERLVLQDAFKAVDDFEIQLPGIHRIELARNIKDFPEAVLGSDDLFLQVPLLPEGVLIDPPCKGQLGFQKAVFFGGEPDLIVFFQLDIAANAAHQEIENECEPICRLIEQRQPAGSGKDLCRDPGQGAKRSRPHAVRQTIEGRHNDDIRQAEIHDGEEQGRIGDLDQKLTENKQRQKLRDLDQRGILPQVFFQPLPPGARGRQGVPVGLILVLQIREQGDPGKPAVLLLERSVLQIQAFGGILGGKVERHARGEPGQPLAEIAKCDVEVVVYCEDSLPGRPGVGDPDNQIGQILQGKEMDLGGFGFAQLYGFPRAHLLKQIV